MDVNGSDTHTHLHMLFVCFFFCMHAVFVSCVWPNRLDQTELHVFHSNNDDQWPQSERERERKKWIGYISMCHVFYFSILLKQK